MRILIAITTYERLSYLKQLINSIFIHAQPHHTYHIVVNDDGSKDGTRSWLDEVNKPINCSIHVTYSNNKNIHHADNNLIYYAGSLIFDYGFKMDDDVYIIKKGWEDLYINSGLKHAVHFSMDWATPKFTKTGHGQLVSHTDIHGVQGAFWTFTPEVLATVGYIDTRTMGRRGQGHVDFTWRCCRAGFNDAKNVWDAAGSGQYIKYQPRQNYKFTPNYENELKQAIADQGQKIKIMSKKDRPIFFPMLKSPVNHFFEHVYVINLKNRPDRRKRMEHKLSIHHIHDYTFFDAVDGKLHHKPSDYLRPGELGCYMSHMEVIKDAYKKGYGNILILEDDLIFHEKFRSIIHIGLNKIPRNWGMIYLGASDYNYQIENVGNVDFRDRFYRANKIDGTFAYGLSRKMIHEIYVRYSDKRPHMAIDTTYHNLHSRAGCYILDPMPVIADVSDSDIRQARDISDNAKKVNWNLNNYR